MKLSPYEIERLMGIEAYLTGTDGIGGRLRDSPSDFAVEEVPAFKTGETGGYLVARLTKENWETHHLIRDLSRQLGISDDRIGLAGTKDKRAITTQLISIYGVTEDDLKKITLPRIRLTPVGRSSRPLVLGDLEGNNFDIRISGVAMAEPEIRARLDSITGEISATGGVPNFFGYQRFGIRRPITHLVGEKLIRGDLEGAAMDYIARSFPDENPENIEARDYVFRTRDFKKGLDMYALNLRYERTMMHRLIERPGDYAGAFRSLPGTLMKMFVSAYQSYLFNRMLSQRLLLGMSITTPQEGDTVCFNGPDGKPDVSRVEQVTKKNRPDINYLYKRKRVTLVLPLVGKSTRIDLLDEVSRKVLDDAKVTPDNFEIPLMPELSSHGIWRAMVLPVSPSLDVEGGSVRARFFLTSGSYATTVLREYMKANPRCME
ncbi:tRNA pseudouridine(13) synthase TruD [Methanocella arvoryzae]|uniref:Probable tRNA pseudouridine synthase D n=1 Tax=Methanocella arvoryzae (strain DSM 22066 / NBRC 105507 / MRE50) TaxID=351160 RepID=Q0W1J0_METAR|nr:tRNA pseudouridine(13) synthase TruD [Methanocella arvoryzae]CAJ37753.1 putative tRNA pseudouridine synthase D [Methanocella arvoryzae MRE50]